MNLFGLPMDAGANDLVIGYDELGRPVRRSLLGHEYGAAYTEPTPVAAPIQGRAERARASRDAFLGLLGEAVKGLTAPGRAARGEPVTLGEAWATALDYGALGAPMPKPEGALGIFAGRKAKTADLGALARAEELAKAGASRDEIWRDTGWFQGVDGQWRFEIDDSASALTDYAVDGMIGEGGEAVGVQRGLMRHDDLFAAYPDAGGINSRFRSDLSEVGGYQAAEVGRPEQITADAISTRSARSMNLHELQHAIQRREGFALGGNPSQFYPEDLINRIQEVDGRADSLLGQSWRAPTPEARAALRQQSDALFEEKRALQQQAAQWRMDQYKRLAGETEARNVQTRRDFTPEQRRATPPWATQDVPDVDQIVRGLLGL